MVGQEGDRLTTTPRPKTATEIIGDGSPRVSGWTMTCLPCDSTWIGNAADHACRWQEDWRRDFWIRRLRWATTPAATLELLERGLEPLTVDGVEPLVDKPIARARMAELLGDRWLVSGDVV